MKLEVVDREQLYVLMCPQHKEIPLPESVKDITTHGKIIRSELHMKDSLLQGLRDSLFTQNNEKMDSIIYSSRVWGADFYIQDSYQPYFSLLLSYTKKGHCEKSFSIDKTFGRHAEIKIYEIAKVYKKGADIYARTTDDLPRYLKYDLGEKDFRGVAEEEIFGGKDPDIGLSTLTVAPDVSKD